MLSLLSAHAGSRPLLGSRAVQVRGRCRPEPGPAISQSPADMSRLIYLAIRPGSMHDIAEFLQRHPPFGTRSTRRRSGASPPQPRSSSTPPSRRSSRAPSPRAEFAYVVRRGSVELSGGGRLFDLVGEGDMFGFASLLAESPLGFVARAAEDPLVYAGVHAGAAGGGRNGGDARVRRRGGPARRVRTRLRAAYGAPRGTAAGGTAARRPDRPGAPRAAHPHLPEGGVSRGREGSARRGAQARAVGTVNSLVWRAS